MKAATYFPIETGRLSTWFWSTFRIDSLLRLPAERKKTPKNRVFNRYHGKDPNSSPHVSFSPFTEGEAKLRSASAETALGTL